MDLFDYPNKISLVREPYYLSGNVNEDLKEIANYYNHFEGVKKDWIKSYLLEEA